MTFSDTVNNTGVVEQVRAMTGLDSAQWPTVRISNSCNNWLDFLTGYAIGHDTRFQWDDTNHTKLPEGTTPLTINVTDYSFLTDEQGNRILTLLGVSRLDSATGKYIPLIKINRNDPHYDETNFGTITGTPTYYDEIADNIIRLDTKPSATVAAGLKFFFQRTGSYFDASSTTKEPGVAIPLHRGFVIASSYDAALSKGLANLGGLSIEQQKEIAKVEQYFAIRNQDEDLALEAHQDNSWQL